MSPLVITMLILLFVFIALLSGKVSYGVVGGLIVVLLMVTGILPANEALSGFSNTNVVIMFCMMVVSAGLMRTSLVSKIVGLVGKIGKSETALVAGFGLIAAAMAQFMNAFVAVACLIPLINGMCEELEIKRTKVLFPVMVIALTWVFLLPVGMGATTFAQMNGYLEAYGSDFRFGLFDMMIARMPGVIIQTAFAIFVLPRLCPDTSSMQISDVGRSLAKTELAPWREKACYMIAVGTVVMMVLAGTLHISIYLVACISAVLIVLFGILDEKQAFASINWGMIFLFAGVLPLATALNKTGASDVIANFIVTLLGGTTNPWIISIVFVVISFICTQFLSNTACVQVFTPLALMVCVQLKMNPVGILGLINIGCTASYLTPMANPGIPLVMAGAGYSVKDCIKMGIVPGILICAVGIIWCSLFFPAY